jgi:hypothetical protein
MPSSTPRHGSAATTTSASDSSTPEREQPAPGRPARRRRRRRPGRAPTTAARCPSTIRGPTSQSVSRLSRTSEPTTMSNPASVSPGTGDAGPTARGAGRRRWGHRRPGRHEQPQQQVDGDAGAGQGQRDQADPPQQRVDAAVVGQAAGDAADDLVAAAALQRRPHREPGRRGYAAAGGSADGGAGGGADVMAQTLLAADGAVHQGTPPIRPGSTNPGGFLVSARAAPVRRSAP